MRYLLSLTILFLLFSGCSFQLPANQSQFKTTNAFSSYTKNFLSNNDALAENDLQRAVDHAKKSADFNALARIYLGECALHISVGLSTKCKKYTNIQTLIKEPMSDSYYRLIMQKIKKDDLSTLPNNYKEFASYLVKKEYNKAYSEVINMDSISSQLISASLIKESLDKQKIKQLIDIASFNGYQKSVLFWLYELEKIVTDKTEKEKILKKIDILKAKK